MKKHIMTWILGLICIAFMLPSLGIAQETTAAAPTLSVINPAGMTLEKRFPAPDGFKRTNPDDGYAKYLRSLPMLPDGSKVMLFNGEEKEYQDGHVAVVDIDVGKRDLQQCADACLRLRTEYLYQTKQYEKMIYHLSNWQELSWPKWVEGYRLKYLGHNKTEYKKTAGKSDSYQTYRKWLDALMMYAGVSSLMKESKKLELSDIQPGDVVSSTGHMIMIIDVVENSSGEKRFLLAQSYMPAQQIEVLKNLYRPETPWYSTSDVQKIYDAGKTFVTPEWEFPAPGPNVYRLP